MVLNGRFHYVISLRSFLLLLSTVMLFSGCQGLFESKPVDLAGAAPDIPSPPQENMTLPGQGVEEVGIASNAYPDIRRLDPSRVENRLLKEAINRALDKKIIEPTTETELFRPDDPVTRVELAEWLVAFKHAELVENDNPSFNDVNENRPTYKVVETVASNGWMDGFSQGGEQVFRPDQFITRQELCRLFVQFSGKSQEVEAMDESALETASPTGEEAASEQEANMSFTLRHWKDFSQIQRPYRKAVAFAYRQNLPLRAFGLSPSQLTQAPGFQPLFRVKRREAFLLLATLYN
ncbi:MAG: S-layer homology domain-containing protein [Cyanobacteria bacterium]|nr:S-layer homology domain-containing protein [Cyanobacteriota bacterium]